MYSEDLIYKTPEKFDIMSYMDVVANELKTGISLFNNNEKIITVFGSARADIYEKEYLLAEQLGQKLAENGFSVMTGGGPGIMEATLKGAFLHSGNTYGINVVLPHEQDSNKYIAKGFVCKHLFTRKVLLTRNVSGYIVMPGGFGTLDELFEVLTLMNTDVQSKIPLVLIGVDFWSGLIEWMKSQLLTRRYITEHELNYIILTDDIEEVVHTIKG